MIWHPMRRIHELLAWNISLRYFISKEMNPSQQSQLAEQFIKNTVKVKKDETVWIEYWGLEAKKLADACAEKVKEAGGIPFLDDQSAATIDQIKLLSEEEI